MPICREDLTLIIRSVMAIRHPIPLPTPRNPLPLDAQVIERCRAVAKEIGDRLHQVIDRYSTESAERTVLRAYGIIGSDPSRDNQPLVNTVVSQLRQGGILQHGAAFALARKLKLGAPDIQQAAEQLAYEALGPIDLRPPQPGEREQALRILERATNEAIRLLDWARITKETTRARYPITNHQPGAPFKYAIVATGNIFDDADQAENAAIHGADIIAVIRATAQSLIDFVPIGLTSESTGGGTWATQENMRLIRARLDEAGERLGRHVMQTNYSSGLCMPEIAWMGAAERLDMMLNDSMYGILFRNINPIRTLVDQSFSRRILARAGILINTGEDNYLTTADAVEAAHTVLASQFINEALAHRAGLPNCLIGLGHAFEIDKSVPDSFLLELAQAELVRQVFPQHPIKWMPATKHKTGDIFWSHRVDGLYDHVGVWTEQSIELLGMMTEAIHTPLLMDRMAALIGAQYAFTAARSIGSEVQYRSSGLIATRANQVLADAERLLTSVNGMKEGLFTAVENGVFAEVKRPKLGGRGYDGIVDRSPDYTNPILTALERDHGVFRSAEEIFDGSDLEAIHAGERPVSISVPISGLVPEDAHHSISATSADDPIRLYGHGHSPNVEVSFVLNVPPSEKAKEAARLHAERNLGLKAAAVAHMGDAGSGKSFFVIYGRSDETIDPKSVVVPELIFPRWSHDEVDALIAEKLKRKVVIVGACTGSDAHTVGIDAILNMKGYDGDKGLEAYKQVVAHNLGGFIDNAVLIEEAKIRGADAILVSQIVTDLDAHKTNAAALIELAKKRQMRHLIIILGGPRIDNTLARELGYDAGFGPGTRPSHVASYVVDLLIKRKEGTVPQEGRV